MRTRALTVLILSLVIMNLAPTTVADDDENHRRTARITTPLNHTLFVGGQTVKFVAEACDKDGDQITLTSYCDGKEVERYLFYDGTGVHEWSMKLGPGSTYDFELVVSEGELESHYFLTLVVKSGGPPPDPGFPMYHAFMAGSVASGIIFVVFLILILWRRPVR